VQFIAYATAGNLVLAKLTSGLRKSWALKIAPLRLFNTTGVAVFQKTGHPDGQIVGNGHSCSGTKTAQPGLLAKRHKVTTLGSPRTRPFSGTIAIETYRHRARDGIPLAGGLQILCLKLHAARHDVSMKLKSPSDAHMLPWCPTCEKLNMCGMCHWKRYVPSTQ
jgi:hypothetical protein